MPLSRIKQTSKIMLMEEFCTSETVPDLYTMLRNENVHQKSEFLSLLEKNLEVRSYQEFVDRFMPSVWEWCESSGDPSCPVTFRYSLERPAGNVNAHEMKLSNNEFYRMIMELYSKKSTSGESNLEFDYSQVADLLSPRKVLENAKQLRRDLQYNYDKMLELGEGAKAERNERIRKIKSIRREIVSQYKDSLMGKIKLALADTEEKLAALPDKQDKEANESETGEPSKLSCRLTFNEKGDLDIEAIQIENNCYVVNENMESSGELAAIIGQDFDKYGGDNNPYIRSLVISNYCNVPAVVLDREELISKRNQYTTIFKASQELFIRAISSAVEKLLNVKVFFDQAAVPGKRLPAPVIVTNCKADKLIGDEKVAESFKYFIRESARETGEYRIWFAIIPAVGDIEFVDNPKTHEESLFDDLDEDILDDASVKTTDGEALVSIDTLKIMVNILKEGKITTFFNYRANEKTGFNNLSDELLESYRKKLESLNGNGYAVFAYPNFTILPKKETAIEIGKTGADGYERKEFLDIPGIYVDSSYVAAGLVVASQNPEYLAYKKYKVERNNPCVSFDLEEGDNRFIMLTSMNREGKGAWSFDAEENITSDMFGFCFCGNTKFYKNEQVNQTYVYTARNMHRNEKGIYDPIYTRLTMDFIMQYLATDANIQIGQKYKISGIKSFISKEVGAWKRAAESSHKDNNILRENEDVIFDEETKSLKVKFRKGETEIALDIERE